MKTELLNQIDALRSWVVANVSDPVIVPPTVPNTVWTVAGNKLLKDGSSFLTLGCYYMARNATQKAERLANFPVMAALGINSVVSQFNDEPADYQFLDLCRAAGIYVLCEFEIPWTDATIAAKAAKVKDRPEVMGFLIKDDVDDKTLTPAQAQARSVVVKNAAPGKISFTTGWKINGDWDDYIGKTDVYMKYSYPTAGAHGLADLPYSLRYTNGGDYLKINAVSNCLFVGGEGQNPFLSGLYSVAETRSMFWQLLGSSCQGIIFYAYREGSMNMSDPAYAALRAEWTALFAEAKQFAPHFLSGTYRLIDHGQSASTTAACFVLGGFPTLLIFANNTSSAWSFSSKPVSSGISPANVLTPINSRYPSGCGIVSGLMNSGSVPVDGVGVWKVT